MKSCCGTFVLTLLMMCDATPAFSQSAPAAAVDLTAVADRVFATWNSTHGPGCAIGVARGGKTLLERGYGLADIASERPITPSTILESGSVAKQFTSTAVLLLMQDGKLALDDDARKYLPELPKYDRVITVRNLLTHTSGLREWGDLMEWQGWPRGMRVHMQSDILDVVSKQKSLNYPVGDYYSYTNSGFLMLRTLVERVSGMTFAQFTTERIFTPLGMTHSQWRDDFTRVVPGLAQAYSREDDGWHMNMPFDNVIGAGGLWTTVGDWLLWNEALTQKKLGEAVGDSITRQMKLTSGLEIQYALGLIVTQYRGVREISHSGSTAGYTTFLARYPDQNNLSIAVMCNVSSANPTAYTHAIVDALVPGLPRATAPDTITMPNDTKRMLRGIYRDTRSNTTLMLDTSQGQLRRVDGGGSVVRAIRDGTFQMGSTRMRVTIGRDGRVDRLQIPTADGDSLVFVHVADAVWTPNAADLASMVGQYRSDEIGVTFSVTIEDGTLTVSPRVGVPMPLEPTYADAFSADGTAVWFTRDRRGKVTAMHFGSARAWDFVSTRVP